MGLFSPGAPNPRRDPHGVEIAGARLTCPHCGGAAFREREVMLNTSRMTAAGLDWVNPSATGFVCAGCGRVESFLEPRGLERLWGDGRVDG